jgi:transposase
MPPRPPYPADVSDDEWLFVLPYVTLRATHQAVRKHDLREVFNALRYLARGGISWRALPHDFPPWHAVFEQAQRWFDARVFEAMVHDLRLILRFRQGRSPHPSAIILDSRTVKSTDSSEGAAYDGAKRIKGRKTHIAVDTLGLLLAAHITPANAQDRDQVAALVAAAQEVSGDSITAAFVDQGYTGEHPASAAQAHGVTLQVVKHPEGTKGFILLPRRWVVERSFAWTNKFRRLARDYERLPATVKGLTFLAAVITYLARLPIVLC